MRAQRGTLPITFVILISTFAGLSTRAHALLIKTDKLPDSGSRGLSSAVTSAMGSQAQTLAAGRPRRAPTPRQACRAKILPSHPIYLAL